MILLVPHSVIESSCIGTSVFGGVCNNSGGTSIHRGPVCNVARLYEAPALINHYKTIYPCNFFKPGIGRTFKSVHWQKGQANQLLSP